MGGHGGINILHEKKWHTYNTSNRIRVERDERNAREQAAAEVRAERQSRLRRKVESIRSKTSRNRGNSDDSDSPPRSSGSNINLFAEEEKEWKAAVKDHNKHIRGQEINNQLAGRSKKRPMSEFDEMASLKPWYLQTRKSVRTTPSSRGREDASVSGKVQEGGRTLSDSTSPLTKSKHKLKHRHSTSSREELRAKRLERERKEHKRAEIIKESIR